MALAEETVVDNIQVLEDSQLQVRTATVIKRDGVEVSRTFHRHVVAPGDDLNSQDAKVKSVGDAVHTAEVIAAYEAAEAAKEAAK